MASFSNQNQPENVGGTIIPANPIDKVIESKQIRLSSVIGSIQKQIYEPSGNGQMGQSNAWHDLKGAFMLFTLGNHASEINSLKSYLQYKVRFQIGFKKAGEYFLEKGVWYFRGCSVAEAGQVPKWDTGATAICLGPLNAMCILDNTEVVYSNVRNVDTDIWRYMTINQAKIEDSYQNSHNKTWFNGSASPLKFRWVPYDAAGTTVKVAADGAVTGTPVNPLVDGCMTFYEFFNIPLNLVNTFFDIDNSVYMNATSVGQMQIRLNFNKYTMSKIFGVNSLSTLAGITGTTNFMKTGNKDTSTGIEQVQLHLYTRGNVSIFQSDLMSQSKIAATMVSYDITPAPSLIKSMTYAFALPQTHKSVNDIIITLGKRDDSDEDSCYVKQRFTLHSAKQIIDYANRLTHLRGFDTIYLDKLQIELNEPGKLLFDREMTNIEEMRQETLRSYNYIANYYTGMDSDFYDCQKWAMKYAFQRINLEVWKLDYGEMSDVLNDGMNTHGRQIRVKFILSRHSQQDREPVAVKDRGEDTFNKIQNEDFICDVYQCYDTIQILQPQNSKYSITEHVEEIAK